MRKYENFCKALNNLREGAALEEPYTVVEQTGIVGLFEICFEQSWKLMKELLEESGVSEAKTGSPREILKTAYRFDMIGNQEEWLQILNTRNTLSHKYSDEDALEAIRNVKASYLEQFEILKAEIESRWLELPDKAEEKSHKQQDFDSD